MKRLTNKLQSLLLKSFPILLLLGLSACSSLPEKADGHSPASNPSQHELVVGDDIAAADLDRELMFNLLAGEFAGVRGDMGQAIKYYRTAAEISKEPKVIRRAAYIALYAGQFEQAIKLTERWYALKLPDNDTILRIRALAFLQLKQLKQLEPAVEAVEQLLMIEGHVDKAAMSALTRLLSKESTPQFALKVAQQLNERHPQQPFLILLLAKFEANLRMYDSALKHTQTLISLDSEMGDAYLVQAQIYAGLGNQDKAAQAISMAIDKRPQDTRLRMQYGRMLVQLKYFDKALEQFEILKQDLPNDENVLLSLGLLSIEVDQLAQAKQYLQELLDKGYHNQQAHYYLGRIQQSQGENMPAIANYERVLEGEYWLDARIRVASLLANSGRIDDALLQLEALQKDNDETSLIKVYLAKGEVLRSVSRNQEAYRLYNTALTQLPENTALLYARALTAEKLDLLDVTESDLKMVIMHEPENATALNALGYTLADRTERLNEAREYIMKAAALLPDDPAILDSLGWVYFRLGQYQTAIEWLSKAFETLRDAEIAAHLGEALWMNGQTDKARVIWDQGKELDGNQAILRDTIQRFQ